MPFQSSNSGTVLRNEWYPGLLQQRCPHTSTALLTLTGGFILWLHSTLELLSGLWATVVHCYQVPQFPCIRLLVCGFTTHSSITVDSEHVWTPKPWSITPSYLLPWCRPPVPPLELLQQSSSLGTPSYAFPLAPPRIHTNQPGFSYPHYRHPNSATYHPLQWLVGTLHFSQTSSCALTYSTSKVSSPLPRSPSLKELKSDGRGLGSTAYTTSAVFWSLTDTNLMLWGGIVVFIVNNTQLIWYLLYDVSPFITTNFSPCHSTPKNHFLCWSCTCSS